MVPEPGCYRGHITNAITILASEEIDNEVSVQEEGDLIKALSGDDEGDDIICLYISYVAEKKVTELTLSYLSLYF